MKTIAGYALTKPQMNLVEKINTKYRVDLSQVDPFDLTAINRVTGVSHACVHGAVAKMVEIVQVAHRSYSRTGILMVNGVKMPVSDFDRIRYLVLAIDPAAYRNLLD